MDEFMRDEFKLECELETSLTKEQIDKIFGKKPGRPNLLKIAVPMYEHEWSKYPEKVRISFEDGTTMVYDIHTEQPAPVIVENIKIIRKWKQGYINQPARRRRRRG